MFGESETGESPRIASPWEALISTPPSPQSLPQNGGGTFNIPKLVPEAEEVYDIPPTLLASLV